MCNCECSSLTRFSRREARGIILAWQKLLPSSLCCKNSNTQDKLLPTVCLAHARIIPTSWVYSQSFCLVYPPADEEAREAQNAARCLRKDCLKRRCLVAQAAPPWGSALGWPPRASPRDGHVTVGRIGTVHPGGRSNIAGEADCRGPHRISDTSNYHIPRIDVI